MTSAAMKLANALLPLAAVVGGMTSLAAGSSLSKHWLFPVVGAEGATALRVFFAAIVLLAVVRPWRWPLSKSDLTTFALYGATIGLMNILFYLSLQTIPFGIAVAIEFLGPLTVTVFSSRRLLDFIWIALASLGTLSLLPISGTTALDQTGVIYALGAAMFWALYIVLGKRASAKNTSQAVSIGMIFAAALAIPYGLGHAGSRLFDPTILLVGLLIGGLSSAIPYTLQMFALKRMPKKTFSLSLSLNPALSAIAGIVILNEFLTFSQWIAVSCVIAAAFGSAYTSK